VSIVRRFHGSLVWDRRVDVLAGAVVAALPEGAKVLDVGCGDGTISAEVLSRRPDVQVTGLDVLVRPDTKIPVTGYDGRRIPFEDDDFDVVVFVDVLHHTEDPVAVLREAARVAKSGLVVKDHLADGLFARPTLRVMDWVGNASFGVALPYNYLTRSQWNEAFAACDLTIATANEDLKLYARPLSWVFDRDLHVVWRLTPADHEHG